MTDKRLCTSRRSRASDGAAAFLNLKRLVRLGKIAELALCEIEERGGTWRPVPTLTPPGRDRSHIALETFLPYVEPSRDSIPGYGKYDLSFPDTKMKRTNGAPIPVFSVVIPGAGLCWTDGAWVPVEECYKMERLGSARVLKNGGVSFFFSNRITDKDGGFAHTIRHPSDPRFKDSEKDMAIKAARYILGSRNGSVGHAEYHSRLAKWLIEDGYVATWNTQILGHADVIRVMES